MSIRYARLKNLQGPIELAGTRETGGARNRPVAEEDDEAHLRRRHRRHQGRGTRLSGRARSRAAGGASLRVDVGTRAPAIAVDVDGRRGRRPSSGRRRRRAWHATTAARRSRRWATPSRASSRARDDIAGIVGIGGGGGTSIVTAGMRELPLGLPKIMVSTLASGDVAPYVDVSDIVMMPSVTDMAGLNRLSAASSCTTPRRRSPAWRRSPPPAADGKPALGLTMFGVTTPCVTAIAEQLRGDYDCLVFHATGTGGRTMEKLADSGLLAGVIDITTTEVCDLLFGGVLPATEDRFGAIARTRLPYVGSVGALDMVNFWAPRDRAGALSRPAVLPAQSQRHADAHDAGRMPRDRRWIGGKLNRLRRAGALPDPGKGRLGARHRGRRLLRSGSRRRAVRGDRGDAAARPPTARIDPPAASHQRSRIRRGRRRGLPRHRQQ